MNFVYQIIFNKSPMYLSDYYDRLSDIEREKIATTQMESFIDFELDNKYTFITICESLEIEKYCNILDDNYIDYKLLNISNDILLGVRDINSIVKNSSDAFINEMFLDDIKDWIYENTDIDTILEKIHSKGLSSLLEVEKKYLESSKY